MHIKVDNKSLGNYRKNTTKYNNDAPIFSQMEKFEDGLENAANVPKRNQ